MIKETWYTPLDKRIPISFEELEAFRNRLKPGNVLMINGYVEDYDGIKPITRACRVESKYPSGVLLSYVPACGQGKRLRTFYDYVKLYITLKRGGAKHELSGMW